MILHPGAASQKVPFFTRNLGTFVALVAVAGARTLSGAVLTLGTRRVRARAALVAVGGPGTRPRPILTTWTSQIGTCVALEVGGAGAYASAITVFGAFFRAGGAFESVVFAATRAFAEGTVWWTCRGVIERG